MVVTSGGKRSPVALGDGAVVISADEPVKNIANSGRMLFVVRQKLSSRFWIPKTQACAPDD